MKKEKKYVVKFNGKTYEFDSKEETIEFIKSCNSELNIKIK